MERGRVKDPRSGDDGSGDGVNHSAPTFTYGEFFEEMCPVYLNYGMTYDEYWDGDIDKPKYYRKAYELRHKRELEERNHLMLVQGAYVYRAILSAYPLYNALSKRNEPYPYPTDLIPLTEDDAERIREEAERKKMEAYRQKMLDRMNALNAKFTRKEE